MSHIHLLALLGFTACACGPDGVSAHEHTLTSTHTADAYRISVLVPDAQPQSAAGYPSIYLLDGDTLLGQLRGTYVELQRSGAISPALLIGIGYADANHRQRDYTPTMADGPEYGGGDAFQEFLRSELIPFISATYPASPQRNHRCIVGHSLGGLSVFYSLFRYNDSFYGYGAASPSLYYDDGLMFALEQQAAAASPALSGRVFIGFGTLDTPSRISASSLAMGERLRTWTQPDFRFADAVFYATSHSGTPAPTFEHAVSLCLQGVQ